jgi:hypothetical protein
MKEKSMIHRTKCRDGRDQSILMGGSSVRHVYYRADLWWRKFLTFDVVAAPDAELMTEQRAARNDGRIRPQNVFA